MCGASSPSAAGDGGSGYEEKLRRIQVQLRDRLVHSGVARASCQGVARVSLLGNGLGSRRVSRFLPGGAALRRRRRRGCGA
ncbi:UNVERIFIED_CONTAM: hypothetical protein K2H54_012870 [Gekko kuhli]